MGINSHWPGLFLCFVCKLQNVIGVNWKQSIVCEKHTVFLTIEEETGLQPTAFVIVSSDKQNTVYKKQHAAVPTCTECFGSQYIVLNGHKNVFLGHLGPEESSCEHNIDILSPFKFIW